jgi:hypothetical protein
MDRILPNHSNRIEVRLDPYPTTGLNPARLKIVAVTTIFLHALFHLCNVYFLYSTNMLESVLVSDISIKPRGSGSARIRLAYVHFLMQKSIQPERLGQRLRRALIPRTDTVDLRS